MQLVEKENATRQQLLNNNRIYIENEVYRAYGVLKNARIIDTQEAMKLLSTIKMGIEMGIFEGMDSKNIDKLMIKIQANNIQMMLDKGFTKNERNFKRAEILREYRRERWQMDLIMQLTTS